MRRQIVGDGEPPISGHVCYRAVLAAQDMPNDLRWPAATLWAAPNTHIVHYPLRGWKLFNVVATVVREQAGSGHNEEAPPEEVLRLFAHNCGKADEHSARAQDLPAMDAAVSPSRGHLDTGTGHRCSATRRT